MTGGELLVLLLALPVLAASALSDLRHLRIPNSHVMIVLAVFVLSAPLVLSLPEIGFRLLAGVIGFAVGFGLFALRMFGGGDVKMLSALLLLVPSSDLVLFLQLFSGCLLVSTLSIVLLQRLPIGQKLGWESCRLQGHVPVGVAMAAATALLSLFAANG